MLRHQTARALAVTVLVGLLVLPGGSAVARCDPPWGAFSAGTHNVLHGRARFARFGTVIGWQEVTRRADRARMVRELGRGYRHYIPRDNEAAAIPVSWNSRRFSLISARSVKVHEGRARVTPSRWISVVALRDRLTRRVVVVVNTHFVSGAFTPGYNAIPWRRAHWMHHRAKMVFVQAQVRRFRPHATLVVMGDFNHRGYLKFNRFGLRPLRLNARSRPIDHQYVGQNGSGGCAERLAKAGSDHYRRRSVIWPTT